MNLLDELKEIERLDREDVLIFNDAEGKIVNVEEAIKAVENCDKIEIAYLKHNQDKNNATVQFTNFWYVDGDIFDVDDFVWCDDTQSVIDSYDAVWCDDVEDYRHVDNTYVDFHGNIYGSDDKLI